jgi:hypothetical protein
MAKPVKQEPESVPAAIRPAYEAVVAITDRVCHEHLSVEYAELARQLAGTLARKRPSPLTSGQPKSWACGIVYALGTVNFLWDESQKPHMRADELCRLFGVSPATGSAKATLIRKLFDMFQMDPRWSLPSMMDRNPLVWMLQVNGMMVDVRMMPREVQEIAFQKGFIPYIPADRK